VKGVDQRLRRREIGRRGVADDETGGLRLPDRAAAALLEAGQDLVLASRKKDPAGRHVQRLLALRQRSETAAGQRFARRTASIARDARIRHEGSEARLPQRPGKGRADRLQPRKVSNHRPALDSGQRGAGGETGGADDGRPDQVIAIPAEEVEIAAPSAARRIFGPGKALLPGGEWTRPHERVERGRVVFTDPCGEHRFGTTDHCAFRLSCIP
jgi:hypothetical protein